MRKSYYLVIICLLLVVCLSACGKSNQMNSSASTDSTQQVEESRTDPTESESSSNEIWGVQDKIDTENSSGMMATAYISLPEVASMRRGAGQVADQSDDTLILFGGQHLEQSPVINSLEEVLSAFLDQPIDVLGKYRRVDYQNFDFVIESTELVNVNNYEMCKYTGRHTFTYNGDADEMNFVAYATQLKANDAYIYWIVIDESADQSMTSTIATYAEKMANSLHE